MDLKTPVGKASGIYKKYAGRLEKLGIKTFEDFIYYFPFRYENYSLVSKIEKVQPGEIVTIRGKVSDIKNEYTKRWKNLQKAKIEDETGTIGVIWFNQPFIPKIMNKGDNVSLSGKIDLFKNKLVMQSPEYEVIYKNAGTIHTGRLVPIYNETKGISSKWIRRQIYKILEEHKQNLLEYIPYPILEENNLIGIKDAIENIHFPKNLDTAEDARKRFSYDEFFLLHLRGIIRKNEWGKKTVSNIFSINKFKKEIGEFLSKLPFDLTTSQKKAVREIFQDLASKKPMNRLLEGEVGSGKTVVATIVMYLSYLNGFQSVLMAPTEILAQQHYKTISELLTPFGVRTDLITGSKKWKMKNARPAKLGRSGEKWKMDIMVGTHAVLSEKINFKNLGLVVIDEQQKFGVEQRAIIRKKGKNPHLLTMTATPIPRTVALVLYGNLDLSLLSDMPKGRRIVKTWLVPPEKRIDAYKWIENQIKRQKSQAFIICPFIEESESMATVKAAVKEFEKLKNIFRDFKLDLLHGKIRADLKEKILKEFREEKTNILVSTPVVEVGIDIPNATIIMIETAERFGLAQLHQLRGRVGRGNKQSYCLLFTDSKNDRTIRRLKSLETIYNGAELAELDLKLRGPGEIYGTAQHGLPALKIASFSDFELIEKTKKEAEKIFPELSKFPDLLKKINSLTLSQVSPD
ncbi:MAG: ATP-dependent DNA helicase RecG [Candidatus Levybacteria bacterium RIFCSPLOWO2_01_FULL_38_13]|nr:MAG: ATP-dependent DNA helicase RecG [Candidatus Levybacteria bacterium RIFCSPHIGHO2_01_FULL_41_15]OGH35269.1 MAG: ATP-dependent DNA helicase RecG [Candidatus Levybacteria bacterium RIFCSPLOWO2_01_FULL_38_13]